MEYKTDNKGATRTFLERCAFSHVSPESSPPSSLAVRWKIAAAIILYSLACLVIFSAPGCTAEETGDTASTIADTTGRVTRVVPLSFQWIGYTISAIAAAVAGIAYGIREAKGKRAMRRSIKAIGDVIDHMEVSQDPEMRTARAKVGLAMKGAKTLNASNTRDDIFYADAVRKGLK